MADDNLMNGNFVIGIISIAVFVLVGLALINGFETTLRDTTTSPLIEQTLGAVDAPVSLGAVGEFPFPQDLTGCFNSSNAADTLSDGSFTISEGTRDGGSITINSNQPEFALQDINCTSLTFLADTGESDAAQVFEAGIKVIALFIAIIVLVAVTAFLVSIIRRKD